VAAEALKVATVGVLVGVVGVVALDAAVDRYVAYSLLLRMGGDLLHPRLLGVGCASVLGLTVVASLVSARRATGVDPAVALRSE
jgi:ABC-type lipoprotein release transport system permease subunit